MARYIKIWYNYGKMKANPALFALLLGFVLTLVFPNTGWTIDPGFGALTGPAVVGTNADGSIENTCEFQNTGIVEPVPLASPEKLDNSCVESGNHVAICIACGGGNEGSDICRRVREVYGK